MTKTNNTSVTITVTTLDARMVDQLGNLKLQDAFLSLVVIKGFFAHNYENSECTDSSARTMRPYAVCQRIPKD